MTRFSTSYFLLPGNPTEPLFTTPPASRLTMLDSSVMSQDCVPFCKGNFLSRLSTSMVSSMRNARSYVYCRPVDMNLSSHSSPFSLLEEPVYLLINTILYYTALVDSSWWQRKFYRSLADGKPCFPHLMIVCISFLVTVDCLTMLSNSFCRDEYNSGVSILEEKPRK